MAKKLRVLFVSGELIAGDLAFRLVKEGCEVKLYIADKSRKDCFENMVEKVSNWRKELDWVGKDGLIVFDDVGYGKIQDNLRKKGYQVVGGCAVSDKLEQDRDFGQWILHDHGMTVLQSQNFISMDKAIDFVRSSKKKWVVKQNDHTSMLNYVGEMDDGSDVINLINSYKNNKNIKSINLQERAIGIEIGLARYFNGNDWVGPVEINIEHKSLYNDNIGPKTAEMGTVMWYEENENFRLYQETLGKLKLFLQSINFKGDVDIDFIVNEKHAYPLEFTTRFGSPAVHLQDKIHISKWKDFLLAIARGEEFNLKYKKEKGIVVSIAIPPFPYKSINNSYYSSGVDIYFKKKLSKEEREMIHFEEVSFDNETGRYHVAGSNGYVLYISGTGDAVNDAREKVYGLVKNIVIPKMFYRTDIGLDFVNRDFEMLKKWGWV